jgi:hypothetical protein
MHASLMSIHDRLRLQMIAKAAKAFIALDEKTDPLTL